MARIPASPGLRMGRPPSTPKTPMLVIVKLPRARSAGGVLPERARATRVPNAWASSSSDSRSASLMLGTMSPRGVAAAMPRFTPPLSTISWAASSQDELSSGLRFSAISTALATISSGEILTSAKSRRALIVLTSSIVAVTSASTHTVTCGAVNADCTIAAAVALRTPLIGMRRSSATTAGGAPSRPRVVGAAARCAAPSTSSRVITPPVPVPVRRRGRHRDPGRACGPAVWPAPHRPTAAPSPAPSGPGAGNGPPCGFAGAGCSASRWSARRDTGPSVAKVLFTCSCASTSAASPAAFLRGRRRVSPGFAP